MTAMDDRADRDDRDDLERMLADELATVDREVRGAAVDTVGLERVGRRERRRRAGVAGTAAAVVATVAVAVAVPVLTGGSDGSDVLPATPPTAPASVADLPVGSPSVAPWTTARRVHAGGVTLDVAEVEPFPGPLFAGGSSAVIVRSDGAWRGVVARDGESHEVVATTGAAARFRLLLSADGRRVAVLQQLDRTTADLFLVDVASGLEIGRTTFTGQDDRAGLSLLNVDVDGRVLVSLDHFYAWDFGFDPVRVEGPIASAGDDGWSYPQGVTFGIDDGAAYGTIDPAGRLEVGGRLPSDDVSWSPTGTRWVHVDGDVEVAGPSRVTDTLLVPRDVVDVTVVGWESDTSVVLDTGTTDGVTDDVTRLRCDVDVLTCEQVPLGE